MKSQALQKQVVSFPLTEGMNTKIGDQVLAPPKLLLLQNGRVDKIGKVRKRNGHKALGSGVTGSTTVLENADALGAYKKELLVFHKQSLYGYSESADTSASKGGCVSTTVNTKDVVKNAAQQTLCDVAINNGVTLTAWEDSRGGVRATVYDTASGAELLSDVVVNASGYAVRCASFGSYLYVLYGVGTDLRGRLVTPRNPNPLGTEITISSSFNSTNVAFDVATQDQYIVVAYNVQGASQTRIHKLSQYLAVQTTVNIAEDSNLAVCLIRGASSHLFVAWYGSGGKVRGILYDVFLTLTVAAFDVETTANVTRIAGYLLPDSTGFRLFYEISAGQTYNTLIRNVSVTTAGSVGTPAVFLRSVGIATKAFAYSPDTTERGFIGIVHDSVLQGTFFVARHDGLLVAKLQHGQGGGLLARSLPSSVPQVGGAFYFGMLTKGQLLVDNSTFLTLKGVSVATVDFSNTRNFASVDMADSAVIVGGVVEQYDGNSVVEHGFHIFPENHSLVQSVGGSLTLTGVYSYIAVYAWKDNQGRVHRSSLSPAVVITLTGSNNQVTVTVPTARLTRKKSPRSEVNIEIYRNENNGSNYYLVTSPTAPLFNDTTADTVSFLDTLSDASLIAKVPLYTTGGVIENDAPPAASLVVVHNERVILGGTEDDSIWYSKQLSAGAPVEFSESFTIPVDSFGGRKTALSTLDDKIIVFKSDAIYYVTGDGPNATGGGGVFDPIRRLSVDVGCIDPKSVARTPDGLIFKSRKGIYLLDRGLQVSYVGADVEAFNDETVLRAVLVPDNNEVRFVTTGPTLVYDYSRKNLSQGDRYSMQSVGAWSIWPGFQADDITIADGRVCAIKRRIGTTSKLVREEPDYYLDVDEPFSLSLSLAWAAFAQIQGFQRVWKVLLLGDYKSPHKLKVSLSYNYQNIVTDEFYWDPRSALQVTDYGDTSPYGADSVYGGGVGGDSNLLQVRITPTHQKCEAILVQVEDLQQSGSCESFSLSAIAFEMGIKRGAMKLPAVQSL